MDSKYIELLIRKCMDLKKSKILFISYNKEVKDFINNLVSIAKEKGIEEVYLEEVDLEKEALILKNNTLEDLKKNKYFDKSIWNEYALKSANFLIIDTEEPGVFEGLEPSKLEVMAKEKRESRQIYRKMVERMEIPWCIAPYPGEKWAKEIFPTSNNPYLELKQAIYNICMINEENPIKCWEDRLKGNAKILKYLNTLELEKLHYSNSLGTDLWVYLPNNYLFESANDNNILVNMPSYEVFVSPIYNKTEGIVYSAMPLRYNNSLIDKFYLRFKEGKVIEYDAKEGKEILASIINSDYNSCYLGECALVEGDSPIAKLKTIFNTTLIDENASCHLALGSGFPECVKDGLNMSDDELLELGINISKNHVDFMVGTPDLKIVGYTKDKREVIIYDKGKILLNN